MRFIHSLPLIFGLLSSALADVQFLAPAAGSTAKGGDVITAHWKDSGKSPSISQLSKYDLYLCAGGDTIDTYEELAVLVTEVPFSRGDSVSFRIAADVGDSKANAYFLKMVASGSEAPVINYSSRFTLADMNGSFSSNVVEGIDSITDHYGLTVKEEHGREELRKRQNVGQYTVPYILQTGPTRYAPMAKRPGSTIPTRAPTPQNPTSPYVIATTYLPAGTVQQTLSATQTWTVSSIENTASPAPHPHDQHVKRFLETWKD